MVSEQLRALRRVAILAGALASSTPEDCLPETSTRLMRQLIEALEAAGYDLAEAAIAYKALTNAAAEGTENDC